MKGQSKKPKQITAKLFSYQLYYAVDDDNSDSVSSSTVFPLAARVSLSLTASANASLLDGWRSGKTITREPSTSSAHRNVSNTDFAASEESPQVLKSL
mmetsp:Transcript_14738/g.32126  ORF Transcript_14738/g.32126 Transcript_14738/m.32126 type:complete len:98 (+) Transcript_14738:97-390(+)